jgi:CxxC motif-containing protein (DUF1111 family)
MSFTADSFFRGRRWFLSPRKCPMSFRHGAVLLLAIAVWWRSTGLSIEAQTLPSIGVIVQEDAHVPEPWRPLTQAEQRTFGLGYAVFNTTWVPADQPAGRTDGLGPLFNSGSCDACHNSRRRGRGPRDAGPAPGDLVIQLGRLLPTGEMQRGTGEYGFILNTSANEGFTPEALIDLRYEEEVRVLPDGSRLSLRRPVYTLAALSGPALSASTVLMPRMPPSVQGAGLLERVPLAELVSLAAAGGDGSVTGRIAWLPPAARGRAQIGRFGWQATEPSVASQTASAFAREMGLTTSIAANIDCGRGDDACLSAAMGGAPEVETALFDALLFFEQLHAVPARPPLPDSEQGERLFAETGCAACHRPTLRIELGPVELGPIELSPETPHRSQGTLPAIAASAPAPAQAPEVDRDPEVQVPSGTVIPYAAIHPYTDLLLHDLGAGLADRDLAGEAVHSEWRTAPLWGLQASVASSQPLRLLHDGRARSIEEAIAWHDGEAREARERFMHLLADARAALVEWIASR